MKAKTVLLEPPPNHFRYSTRIFFLGEDKHGVVRKTDEGRATPKPRLNCVLIPLVQHFMKMNIREQR